MVCDELDTRGNVNTVDITDLNHKLENEVCATVDTLVRISFDTSVQDKIMQRGLNALVQWTKNANARVVYDSNTDFFTDKELFEHVKDRGDIALIAFTTDGDVFGGYYSVAVTQQDKDFYDDSVFMFSFESHGRCETPQLFALKQEMSHLARVKYFNADGNGWFVRFGVYGFGHLGLGDINSRTWNKNFACCFQGMQDTTLTGKTAKGWSMNCHYCTRLVAVQFS